MPPDVTPDPKARSLARGERRYKRKVASPKQWQAIIAAKEAPCRACALVAENGKVQRSIEFHHVVARVHGGDDVADNIVPLCNYCHAAITARQPLHSRLLLERLTDAEYAYMIERGGEQYPERAYGLVYSRPAPSKAETR